MCVCVYLLNHLHIYWCITYLSIDALPISIDLSCIYLWCPTNADADYAARRQSLNFTSQIVTIPLSIETFADGLTEGTETFSVNLENVTVISRGVQAVEAAGRVTLNSTMLPITILDSDCKCYCSIWVTFLPFVLPTYACVKGRYLKEFVAMCCISYESTSPRF